MIACLLEANQLIEKVTCANKEAANKFSIGDTVRVKSGSRGIVTKKGRMSGSRGILLRVKLLDGSSCVAAPAETDIIDGDSPLTDHDEQAQAIGSYFDRLKERWAEVVTKSLDSAGIRAEVTSQAEMIRDAFPHAQSLEERIKDKG